MKKLIFCCGFMLAATVALAQNYAIKVSFAMVPVVGSASEIVLEEGSSVNTLQEYQGNGDGYEIKFAVLLSKLEFSYLLQQYSASKDADDEIGDVTYNIESPGVSFYFFDPLSNPGFNINLGLGKGVARIAVNKEVSGSKLIDDGVAYAKELNYFLGVHFSFWDMYGLTIKKVFQNLKTVTGKEFTNDFITAGLYVQF